MARFKAGLLALTVIVIGCAFAFFEVNPFEDPYELRAVFDDAQGLQPGAPVRTAGVDVGEVTEVEAGDEPGTALVTMSIRPRGLPIHEDTELEVHPRIFLEGNFYVGLHPGTPSAPLLASGSTLGRDQTAHSVSTGQVLRIFQKDVRRSLRTLLDEYARGLSDGGAEGFNRAVKYWAPAYRNTAIASQALLGIEPERDLQRVLRGQQRTFAALDRDPQALKGLVSNLNTTTAALAREDDALRASIPALRDTLAVGRPALAELNDALPELITFARDALPGVRSTGPTIDAILPFITQLRRLVSEDELQGLAAELRRTVPPLVRVNRDAVPFLREARALSSCTSNVLVPFAREPIPEPEFPDNSNEPFYQQAPRAFVGLAGESRIHDANGQMFRVLVGGGPNTVFQRTGSGESAFAQTLFPPQGARPAPPEERPPFRPGVPCETQEPPDMSAPRAGPDRAVDPQPAPDLLPQLRRRERRLAPALEALGELVARDAPARAGGTR